MSKEPLIREGDVKSRWQWGGGKSAEGRPWAGGNNWGSRMRGWSRLWADVKSRGVYNRQKIIGVYNRQIDALFDIRVTDTDAMSSRNRSIAKVLDGAERETKGK